MANTSPLAPPAATNVSGRLRILSLVPFAPRVDGQHGGSRAVGQLLSHLALRHDVALLYAMRPGEPPVDELLHSRCAVVQGVAEPARPRSLAARIRNRVAMRSALLAGVPSWVFERATAGYAEQLSQLAREWRPDVIQVELHVMAQFLPAIASTEAPRILVQHEPGAAGAAEKGRHAGGPMLRHLDAWAWRRFERALTRRVDAVVVFTERDRAALEPVVGDKPLVTIALGVDLPSAALDPVGDEGELLFCGSFRHRPNVDSATRLARTIFPRIRARNPAATLRIVGSAPTAEIERLAGDGVEVVGEVPDTTPHLDRAAVVVLPLRLGGGMRVKVLDALAAGKAVVGSRRAFEGLEITDGVQARVAETDDEFAQAACELLADPSQRRALASSARSWALANLGWESRIDEYEKLYRSLLTAGSAHVAGAGAH